MEGGREKEEEQDGVSVHSPCKAPPSSASSLPKEQQEVELELRLLEALEIYPPVKLRGVHRHFVLYGLMEFLQKRFVLPPVLLSPYQCTLLIPMLWWVIVFCILLLLAKCCRSLDRHFTPDEVLQLLDRFYNLEVLKPDDEEIDILNHEEDFCLPQSYFVKEEP
ncbi:hypothetical protein V6N12_005942 [Hibiscus sabdariffa]|uniref:Uncharacterized protein n=1 Tax=Hibiscus sabdariffa TaxID=183260 RepID=A0ABR2EWI7_9ROSI